MLETIGHFVTYITEKMEVGRLLVVVIALVLFNCCIVTAQADFSYPPVLDETQKPSFESREVKCLGWYIVDQIPLNSVAQYRNVESNIALFCITYWATLNKPYSAIPTLLLDFKCFHWCSLGFVQSTH